MTPEAAPLITPRNLAIWGASAVAALWLLLTALGAVAQETQPRLALMLFPKNGFAYQSRAIDASLGKTGGLSDLRVGPGQLADAREALRREPFAMTALMLIGLDRAAHNDGAPIMTSVHRLNKRELFANSWLINYYGSQGGSNTDQVLGLLDEALKVNPVLAQQYMPAFAQALTNPDTVPVFQRLLAGKPNWEKDFWLAVAKNDAALPNAEVLRSRMLAGRDRTDETDTLLMAAFIRARRMDLALSYARSLPTIAGDHDNMLRNSSFGAVPEMPPLDWELMSDGRISAVVDESRGTLNINAIAGSGGTVARQLVALPGGAYQLLVKLGRAEFTRGSELRVRVRCAEAEGEVLTQKVDGDLDEPFAIPTGSRCRFFWVEVIFSAMDSSGPASTNVAEVRIVRARATQDTEAPAEASDGNVVG